MSYLYAQNTPNHVFYSQGEAFAFARWSQLTAKKHGYHSAHGWDCTECRFEWHWMQQKMLRARTRMIIRVENELVG